MLQAQTVGPEIVVTHTYTWFLSLCTLSEVPPLSLLTDSKYNIDKSFSLPKKLKSKTACIESRLLCHSCGFCCKGMINKHDNQLRGSI